MIKRLFAASALVGVLLLAGCGQELTPEQKIERATEQAWEKENCHQQLSTFIKVGEMMVPVYSTVCHGDRP